MKTRFTNRRKALYVVRITLSMIMLATCNLLAYGQGGLTSSLSGAVTDPAGAVVRGANVTVRNNATNAEFNAVTADNGTFSIPALNSGTYTVIIAATGFKQATVNNFKLDAGVPGSVRVELEVGAANESIVVESGGEVLQTQSANISATFQVKQIANLPLQSRDAVFFLSLQPGAQTTTGNGGLRGTTFNGLPRSAMNVTIDGLNTQDNTNKTTDGFVGVISPRLDAVEEVTVSTATPGAESGGQGAVSIKFVTRGGGNDFHGSVYWYNRNPWLNSNYWFNNRDGAQINKDTGQICTAATFDPEKCKAQRDGVKINQPGFRVGGPFLFPKWLFGPAAFDGRNKAFFFLNYEEFHQPSPVTRQRTILAPDAQAGVFRYAGGPASGVNLLALAASRGQTSTIDPVIGKLLQDIRNSTTGTGAVQQLANPNTQQFTFTNNSKSVRYYPTLRLDFNLPGNHRLEYVYYYQKYNAYPDLINNNDPAFPGFPNNGGQYSDRFANMVTLRSTLAPTLVNEFRFGFNGGTLRFRPEVGAEQFSGPLANQAGFSLGISAAGISNATVTSAIASRNAPLRDFSDTLTWTRGSHSLSFGGQFTQVNLWALSQTKVPSISFGVDANDPANAMFATANFPGASGTDLNNARALYAVLTGRVTAINADAGLSEQTGQYVYLGDRVRRARQRELGVFAQDSWRARPNLTLNYGVRWEVQYAFTPLNSSYSKVTVEGLYGVSGPGNLFKPGTLTGSPTQFIQFREGEPAYNTDYGAFAPSFGFAWSPNFKSGWLKRIAGEGGQTVLRGGYSIAYNRNGIGDFDTVLGRNPGATLDANRNSTIGNLAPANQFPVLLREPGRLGPPAFPSALTFPFTGAITDAAGIFDPNIQVPYSQTWSFGIQREITKDMAVEVRYVGSRNLKGWIDYNFNSVENNVLENGLLNEFKLAQANLRANIAAGRGNTFAYTGAPGTAPLPITLAYFSGLSGATTNNPASYTSTNFTNTTFVNTLALNNPFVCCGTNSYSGALDNNATFRANALRAGLPVNFMLTNPDLRGGVFLRGNGEDTIYHSMQLEVRRRLSRGLLLQGNYTFAKGFISSINVPNQFAAGVSSSFRTPRENILNTSVVRHSFKVNWVYELPFGPGKMLFNNAGGLLDRFVGGWEFDGTARVQSGQLMDFGAVALVGMTREELQDAFGIYFDDAAKVVYSLPKDIIDNTIKAFSTNATSATGYGALGPPSGRYLAPAGSASCIQVTAGQCAARNVFVTGPTFTRVDLSLVKRVRFNERFNFELRAEFLNALNNINFNPVANASSSQTLNQITSAYRDVNNTQDPGGRLGQIVLRLNF